MVVVLVKNYWKVVKTMLTPPKGNSERQRFSLGKRKLKGELSEELPQPKGHPITKDLDHNVNLLRTVFHVPESSDVVFREFSCYQPQLRVIAAYIEGLANGDKVVTSVFQPLMLLSPINKPRKKDPVRQLMESLIVCGQVEEKKTIEEAVECMISGDTILIIEGQERMISVETKGWEHRQVSEAVSERIVRGPQQGFVEVLRANTALLRSILQSPDLVIENIDLGVTSRNRCALIYIAGIANEKMVVEIRRRISSLPTSEILTSGSLEQLLENSRSLFPTVMSTERPDRTAHYLLDGCCAVMVAGDPFVLIAPVTVFSFLESPEDAYVRWPYGNLLRGIRYLGILIAIYLPGLYISIATYHPEMLPTPLLMAIAASREQIPIPLFAEVLLMYFGFELIREAGIRIPSPMGPTIGIVGALLVGEAAVSASLVSPIMVIVIAVTGVASFTTPNQELAMFTRVAMLLVIISGALFGLLGIVALTYIGLANGFATRSLGIPYFSPVAPKRANQPTIWLVAPWRQEHRPTYIRPQDLRRQPEIVRQWDQGKTSQLELESSVLKQWEKGGSIDGPRQAGNKKPKS
jgi:spore germination protein KA